MPSTTTTCRHCNGIDRLAMGEDCEKRGVTWRGQDGRALCPFCEGTGEAPTDDDTDDTEGDDMIIDEMDLRAYDTDALRCAPITPAIRAELARRAAAEATRRRCDECWHEGGTHHPVCSNLPGGVACGCCEDVADARPVAGASIDREARS